MEVIHHLPVARTPSWLNTSPGPGETVRLRHAQCRTLDAPREIEREAKIDTSIPLLLLPFPAKHLPSVNHLAAKRPIDELGIHRSTNEAEPEQEHQRHG
jgi:hypothetical protein